MSKKHHKDKQCCSNCRHQMTGFDGGFFDLPFTCECRIYGETENRKDCPKFKQKITKNYLLNKIMNLEKENEQLRQILKDIVASTDETYMKNKSIYKVTLIFDSKEYLKIKECLNE